MRAASQAARRAQLLDVARRRGLLDRSPTVQRARPTKLTFRSSASWPDTKIGSLVIAVVALAGGLAAAEHARRAAQSRIVLPKATLLP